MVSHFAKEYRRLGHDVTVLTTTNNRQQQGLEHWNGLRVHRVYAPPYPERWRAYLSLCNPWVVKSAYQVLLQEKPDALHAHNVHYYLSYHLLKMAADIGIPVGLTLHDVMAVDFGKFTQGIPSRPLGLAECGLSGASVAHLSGLQAPVLPLAQRLHSLVRASFCASPRRREPGAAMLA